MRNLGIEIPQYAAHPYMKVVVGGQTFTDGAHATAGGILQISDFSEVRKSKSMGASGSMSVTLDLKVHTLTDSIIGTSATVSVELVDLGSVSLFTGRIANDIVIDPDAFTISFTIESMVESDAYLKHVNEDEDFPYLGAQADGETWPLGFGSVIRAKALPLKNGIEVTGLTNLTESSTLIDVSDKITLPLGHVFEFSADHILCSGTLDSDGITLSAINLAWYTDVPVSTFLRNTLVVDSTIYDLRGKYCLIQGLVFYCADQKGTLCYFNRALEDDNGNPLTATVISDVRGRRLPAWTDYKAWTVVAPYDVVSRSATDSDLYIFNSVPSSRVAEVVGKLQKGRMTQFSSTQYTVELNTTLPDGSTASTIKFNSPLSTLEGGRWTEEVYVSFVSTLSGNPVDVIQYLLTNYTTLSIDVTSFASAKATLATLPFGFTITEPSNALTTCEELAALACCTLYVKSNTAYLYYLPSTALETHDDLTDYIMNTRTDNYLAAEELVTSSVTKWSRMASEGQRKYQIDTNIQVYGYFKQETEDYAHNVRERVEITAKFWAHRLGQVWKRVKLSLPLWALKYELFDIVSVEGSRGQIVEINFNTTDYKIELEVEIGDAAYFISDISNPGPLDPLDGIEPISYAWANYQLGGDEAKQYELRIDPEYAVDGEPCSPNKNLRLREMTQIALALYEVGTDTVKSTTRRVKISIASETPGYKIYAENGTEITSILLVGGKHHFEFYIDNLTIPKCESKNVTLTFAPMHNSTIEVEEDGKEVKVPKYLNYTCVCSIDSHIYTNLFPINLEQNKVYDLEFSGPHNGVIKLIFDPGFDDFFVDESDQEIDNISESAIPGLYQVKWKYIGGSCIANFKFFKQFLRPEEVQ